MSTERVAMHIAFSANTQSWMSSLNFIQSTNCFIFGIVAALCKLVPKTNRHEQNDVQVPTEKRYNMGSYWFIVIVF